MGKEKPFYKGFTNFLAGFCFVDVTKFYPFMVVEQIKG